MAIRFDQIQLSDDGNHLYPYIEGTDGYLAIRTASGLTRIGAGNSSYSHFFTDRGNYYFNAAVSFDGNISAYDGNENLSNWNNIDASAFRSKADTNYYLDPDNTGTSLKAAGTVHASNSNMSSYQLNGTYVMDSSRNLVNIVGITSTGDAVLGNSRTDKVNIYGNLGIGHNNYPKIAYPGQNALWSGSGSTTGQIVIDLPGTLGNYDMMYMEIDVYEYSSDHATKIIIGGHNWNSGGNSNTSTTMWYNAGVRVIGSMSKPIYLGRRNDGSNERRCIAIGETTSTWSYATVHVHKVHGADFYGTAIDWVGDWNIAQTTSTSYFTKNPTTNFNLVSSTTLRTHGRFYASYIQAATEVIAPIFYDSGNTSYYVNPAGTSLLNIAEFDGDVHFGGGENAIKVTGSGNQDIKVGSTSGGYARIYLDGSNGDFSGSDYIYIGQNDDKSVHFYADSNTGTTTFTSKGSTNLVMDGANSTFHGNVGVGVSPAAKLHVLGDTGGVDSIARFQNTNSAKVTRLQLLDSAGTVGDALIAYNHSNASSALHYLGMGVNNSTTLVINNDDKVGIGVTDPDARLQVKGPTSDDQSYNLRLSSADDQELMYVRNDGIVKISHNYLYVDNSAGLYSNGAIRARAGVTDDGGTLGLGGNGQVNNLVLTSNTSASFAGELSVAGNLTGLNGSLTTTANYFQLNTPSGYVQIGAMNTSHAHIYTDRPSFYTNKPILVSGDTVLTSASGVMLTGNQTITGNKTFNNNLIVNGITYGLYHAENASSTESGSSSNYYHDPYGGGRHLAMFIKNARADIIRYAAIADFQYWNGLTWVTDNNQLSNVKKLLDGRQDTSWYFGSTYYKFRFSIKPSTSWPTTAKVGTQTSWTGSTYPGHRMIVEEYDGSSWGTRVTAKFGGQAGGSATPLETTDNNCDNWGWNFISTNRLHTGNGNSSNYNSGYNTRITIDFYGWSPSNSSYVTVPMQNIFITSNFSGTENTDYTNLLDYDRNITTAGAINLGHASDTTIARSAAGKVTIEGNEIYHEGHKPTYTELGTMAYSNLTGTPTIPSGNFVYTDTTQTITGIKTFNDLRVPDYVYHSGDTDTHLSFDTNQVILTAGNGKSRFRVLETEIEAGQDVGSNTQNYSTKLRLKGKNNWSGGTNWYGNYGQLIFHATSNMTSSARRYLFTNAYQNNQFAIVQSSNVSTDPSVNDSGMGVNSGDLVMSWNNSRDVTIHANTRSPVFYDSDNTGYYVNPAGDSQMNQIHLADYVRHLGDLDTYFGFNGVDQWKLHVGGGDRLIATTSQFTSNLNVHAPIYYDKDNTSFYANPAGTSILSSIQTLGIKINSITSNNMMGYHTNANYSNLYGYLGVDVNGKVGVIEKEITFSIEGSGWVGRHSNPVKLLEAPGADKMIVVQEINILINYTAPIGIGSSGICRTTDNTAYAIGFYQGSGTNGNFTVTGVMPRATMQFTTTTNDRIVNRDVPVEGTKLYPNKALYWKTTRDAANNTNSYPGAQHIVKVRYRILDVSTEFTGAYTSAQNINSSSITTISQAF